MSLKDIFKKLSNLDEQVEKAKPAKPKPAKGGEVQLIPYDVIAKELKRALERGKRVVGRLTIVPSHYIIFFSKEDRKSWEEVENVLIDELSEELFHASKELDPKKRKEEIFIEIRTDPSLSVGDLKIECHIKMPEGVVKAAAPEAGLTVVEMGHPSSAKSKNKSQSAEEELDAMTMVRPQPKKSLYSVTVTKESSSDVHEIQKEDIAIGRDTKADIRIKGNGTFISREHARLRYRDGKIFLLPLGDNGVVMNGDKLPLKEELELENNDEFVIEEFVLKVATK